RGTAIWVYQLSLDQKQFIFQQSILPFSGKEFSLQQERIGKFHSPEPAHPKIRHDFVHICAPLGTPKRAASCERRCVKPIASASAASASGVSVRPRSARTMNAT